MVTKKLEIEELKAWWLDHCEYLDDIFPEDIEFKEIIVAADRELYINIIRYNGITHLLLLLSFLENFENYESCGEIKLQIEMYNKQYNTVYNTRLRREGEY